MQHNNKMSLFEGLNNNERIIFPIDFDLKVILDTTIPDSEHEANITRILEGLNIRYKVRKSTFSKKARFISISVGVHLTGYEQMQMLYVQLKEIPGVRYAL